MKRYLVFGGQDYYPSGGVADLLYDTDELTEVVVPDTYGLEWVNILDTRSGQAVDDSVIEKRILRILGRRDELYRKHYVDPGFNGAMTFEQRASLYEDARKAASDAARVDLMKELGL